MDDMVERVALALRRETASRRKPGITEADMPPLAELAPGIGEMYRRQARAAIAELRDPSFAMVMAGHKHCRRPPQYSMDSAQNAWRAMIDAALGSAQGVPPYSG